MCCKTFEKPRTRLELVEILGLTSETTEIMSKSQSADFIIQKCFKNFKS
jgi:hypothetical protein